MNNPSEMRHFILTNRYFALIRGCFKDSRNFGRNSNGKVRFLGEQGRCSGESARLPPMCPESDSRIRRHMWAEFVGSLLRELRFSPLLKKKNNI